MNIAVKDKQGNKVDMPLFMRISNEGVTYFTEHTPVYYPEDPDQMMYFKSKLHSNSDAMLLYLKFNEETKEVVKSSNLYTVYAKSGSQPSSTDYDYTSILQATHYDEYGYKIFIKGGILKKGDVFIALKAIGIPCNSTF